MRRAHVPTTAPEVSAAIVPASAVPSATSVLCQRNGSLHAGAGQRTRCNQHYFSEDRTVKEKARHTGTLPAAFELKAARFARIRSIQV
jgi:hypothetical protein